MGIRKNNRSGNSLLGDSVFNLISQVVGLIFGIASGIVLARMLGAEARGEYGMLILLPQTAVALLSGGVGPAVAYCVSSGKWKDEDVIPLTAGLCVYATVIGLLFVGVALLFRDFLLGDLPIALLAWAMIIYPASLCVSALQGVYTGYQNFRLQMKCAVAAAAASFVLLLIPVGIYRLGIVGAVYGHIAGLIVSVAIYASLLRNTLDHPVYRVELRWNRISKSLSFGGKASVANALGFLNYRLDQFFVNGMIGTYGVGIYALAVSIVEKLWILAGN